MKVYHICTIFPAMLENLFEWGILSKAVQSGIISVNAVDIRQFAKGRHRVTDDYPYGGGVGLVMKPEPVCEAVDAIRKKAPTRVILMDPCGEKFTQKTAERLQEYDSLTFICGRYEGVDERVRDLVVDESLSLGDFILTGGEFAAITMIDAIARLVPGVLGDSASAEEESFTTGTLEYPHYTRPPEYRGLTVPEVLLSGNHADIVKWREEQSLMRTGVYRPDMLPFLELSEEMQKELYAATEIGKGKALKIVLALMHYPMKDKQGDLVCTSITNMDLHDISRSAATYGVEKYFVVNPLKSQREIAERVIKHWTDGYGAIYNSNRRQAFGVAELCDSILCVLKSCEDMWGEKPLIIATTARPEKATISAKVLGTVAEKKPVLILFGTGWGFTQEVFDMADYVLEPVVGAGDFNHLSVRSAVAIVLDRLTKA